MVSPPVAPHVQPKVERQLRRHPRRQLGQLGQLLHGHGGGAGEASADDLGPETTRTTGAPLGGWNQVEPKKNGGETWKMGIGLGKSEKWGLDWEDHLYMKDEGDINGVLTMMSLGDV